jgi:hypothetical protein
MYLRLRCQEHHLYLPVFTLDPKDGETKTLTCPKDHQVQAHLSASLRERGEWDECPSCGAFDAYVQKDVPKNLFLALLIPGLLLALYTLEHNWLMGVGLLVGFAAIDFVLFKILPDVLVCYRCDSQIRGITKIEKLRAYDHHVAEKYRQE